MSLPALVEEWVASRPRPRLTLVTQDDGPSPLELDAIGERLRATPRDERARWVNSLTSAQRSVVDRAVQRARWNLDPSTFAEHLDPDGFTRYRYAALLGCKFREAALGIHPLQVWMLPARLGKSTMASRWGPAWYLNRWPDRDVILTSYGDDLARGNSGGVRDILDGYPDQLGHDLVRRDRSAVDRWNTIYGGQCLAAGVGSSMTGWGGHGIVVDDPLKNWDEATSAARREKVWNWFTSVVWLRRQTGIPFVIVVMTRWHADDLIGRLLKPADGTPPEPWHVVRIPAIAEEPNPDGEDWERLPDPLGRKPGEVIEPDRFPLEEVQGRLRVLGTFKAAALEQQRPSAAEGTIVKRAWWRFYTARPTEQQADDWLMVWDASFKETTDGSFVVGAVWARQGANKYLIDLVRDRMNYPTFRSSIVTLAAKWPWVRTILVEDKANGPAVIDDLRGHISGLVARTPQGSKESRVHAVSGDIEAGNVYLPDPVINDIDAKVDRMFVHDYIDELAAFPTGSHDDQVDVTTMALLEWPNVEVSTAVGQYQWSTGSRGR